MSEENKNLNEEEVTEEAVETVEETAEEAEAVETAEETAEVAETVEPAEETAETAEAVETTEEGETTEVPEMAYVPETEEEVPETEVVSGNNKKVVMGVIIGIAVLVIAAVIVVFALFGKTWFNPYNKGHVDTTGRTIGEVADMMGMEYDEFLETYGLPSDMPKSTIESAAQYMIPLGKAMGLDSDSLSEIAKEVGWDESITLETPYGEAYDKTQLKFIVGEEGLATFKETFGLGDDVTGDTFFGDIRKTVELKQKEEYEAQLQAEKDAAVEDEEETDSDTDADTADDTDATAETDAAAETDAEASAVPVE